MTLCGSPIKARVARFTKVDVCGVPILGEDSAQVTVDGFVSIANTPNYEDGQRFLQRKANGEPCVNEVDAAFLNWIEQTVMLCSLDPDLLAMVTGEQIIFDGPDAVGTTLGEGLINAHYSKEIWQPVAGEGACDAAGVQRFAYWAFPHNFDGKLQPFTMQNDVFEFGWTSRTKRAAPQWDIGDPWLADTPTAIWEPGKHMAWAFTVVPPPEAGCGAMELVS